MIPDCFARIENRVDELVLHFEILKDQLHVLCEVISCNKIQFYSNMNGRNVTYEVDCIL